MAITFVEDECKQSTNTMKVVVQGPDPTELTSRQTRDAVLVFARRCGFPARGISSLPQTYPVDSDGKTDEDVILGKRPLAAHRADYTLSAGIVA
jgi:hypothetical protein